VVYEIKSIRAEDGGARPPTSGEGSLITSEQQTARTRRASGQPPTRHRISGRAPWRIAAVRSSPAPLSHPPRSRRRSHFIPAIKTVSWERGADR